MELNFIPLTEAHLPFTEAWFDDAETRLYLGGRGWVRRAIELSRTAAGEEFRGRQILSRHVWVVFKQQTPVALIDVEPYDDDTAGFAFVVAPELRRGGIGTQLLLALDALPELRDVRCFIGGVEPQNLASRRCLEKAGFQIADTPDDEEMLHCKRWRTSPTVPLSEKRSP
ncbi:hypothetical protein IAD21_06188 [Abditibacteriota bacterium]|nr:hypothetical protein IAD21_06188 [Abditibacteriota bacterium]